MYAQIGFHCFVTVPEPSRLPTYALLLFNMYIIHVLFTVRKRTNRVYPDGELIVLSMCLSLQKFPYWYFVVFDMNIILSSGWKERIVYAKTGDPLMGPHVRACNISYWCFAIFYINKYCLQFDRNDCVNPPWVYKNFLHVFLCISTYI